jgi:hypothetical protein
MAEACSAMPYFSSPRMTMVVVDAQAAPRQ